MKDEQLDERVAGLKPMSAYDSQELAAVIDRTADRLAALDKKYWHLVWYARRDPRDPRSRPLMDQVEADYPAEVEELLGEAGSWTHGFNSGVLATVRLIGTYIDVLYEVEGNNRHIAQMHEEGIEEGPWTPYTIEDVLAEAEEEFPWLET